MGGWAVLFAVSELASLFDTHGPPFGARVPANPDVRYEPQALIAELLLEKVDKDPLEPGMRLLAVHADRVAMDRPLETGTWRVGRGPEPFDLRETTLLTARPLRGWWPKHRKAVDRRWELTFAWRGHGWRLRGPWIVLAHVGSLAGWPEPT